MFGYREEIDWPADVVHRMTMADNRCRCLGGHFSFARKPPTIVPMNAATHFPPIPTARASRGRCEVVVVQDEEPRRLELSGIRFTPAASRFRVEGLLGWLSFVLNGVLRVDSVAVRCTLDGRMSLSFPERVAQDGSRHPIVRPIDGHAREALEAAVIDALEVELRKIS